VTCIVCVSRVTKWSPSGLRKTLRLVLQAAECLRVDDPIAVALERRAKIVRRLIPGAAPRARGARRGRAEALLFRLASLTVASVKGRGRADLLHGSIMPDPRPAR
jgi:hypothetical protein